MLLDCKFHKYFSVFFSPPLGGTGWPEFTWSWVFPISLMGGESMLEFDIFLFSGQLGSDNNPTGQLLINQFPLSEGLVNKNGAVLVFHFQFMEIQFIFVYLSCYRYSGSPATARSMRKFFSDIYCGNLVKILEVNLKIL